jgi:ATP-dependent RNA helicase DeaD
MTSFEDLGLREELVRTAEDEDIEHPTGLQAAVIPVLRRAGNLVARTSTGSGKTLAYTLGVLDRLKPRPATDEEGEADEPTGGIRVLVLVPTEEAAERVARTMFPYAQASELSVTTTGGTWATSAAEADVLVATPSSILNAVRGSTLKLDTLEALILDGASAMQELGHWEAIDTLLDNIPRDTQRVVISSALTPEIEDLIDRRVKRALRYPAEPAIAEEGAAPTQGEVGYVLVPEREKVELLARLLSNAEGEQLPPVLHCRTDERAALVAEALTVRGFLVGELDDPDADVAVVAAGTSREELASDAGDEPGRSVSYDVPADQATLLARHGGDPRAIVFVEPRELAHLREIARQASLATRAIPVPAARDSSTSEITTFREAIRRALREEDLGAQVLVLEPLFEEFDAIEVAAATAALLRQRRPVAIAPTAAAPMSAPATAAPSAASSTRAETGPPPTTWARLYIGVGDRDGARPGDIVGAIAGEANIPGSCVGKIEIRDTFSIVEVQADVAEQVIRTVNGTTIKGRSARVDYDRAADRARKGPDRGGGVRRQVRSGGTEGRARPPVRRPDRE